MRQSRTSRMQGGWSLVSTHFLVLTCIVDDPAIKLTEIAESLGITVRQVSNILGELVDDGFVIKERDGRRNAYTLALDLPFEDGVISIDRVADLLDVVVRVRDIQAAVSSPVVGTAGARQNV